MWWTGTRPNSPPALIEDGGVWSYKRPSKIIVFPTLPATSTGKILKHRLAESFRRE
jgi:non-ribosomal peptide synthetase component E (peptide arylation enzyme)